MTPPEDRIEEAKAALADRWAPGGAPIGDLKRVLTYEPTSAPALPRATVNPPLGAPMGGRTWVWRFDVRLWVAMVGDAEASQKTMDRLIPQVVTTLEADKSLGGFADDAAISSGDGNIVRPREGQPVFVVTCRCSVETTEPI
jgi:hypothetical protein